MKYRIPYNVPYLPRALDHLTSVVERRQVSGHGYFTDRCQEFFGHLYQTDTLLTSSCTDALEMTALLAHIEPDDEVIMPSFTFTSTANAFVLRGARIIFADTQDHYPNMDPDKLEELITPRTKAIVCVHYAGVACEMDKLVALVDHHGLILIEDAAHAVSAYYKDRLLGTFGRFATISFHETKNITAGEGGLLIVNNPADMDRAHILWEKGTDRVAFHRGQKQKYKWVDVGSSFLPSELNAAVLYGQLESFEMIQQQRIELWNHYYERLLPLQEKGLIRLPVIPPYATINGHLFYLECNTNGTRNDLIRYLSHYGIQSVFHYLPLHLSPFYIKRHDSRRLNNSVRFSETILRLPLYYDLSREDQDLIIDCIFKFHTCTCT